MPPKKATKIWHMPITAKKSEPTMHQMIRKMTHTDAGTMSRSAVM